VNLAVKDSIGGWKENSIVYRSKNTCSTIKYFYGKAWIPFMKGLGFNNFTCPLPAVGIGYYINYAIHTKFFFTQIL